MYSSSWLEFPEIELVRKSSYLSQLENDGFTSGCVYMYISAINVKIRRTSYTVFVLRALMYNAKSNTNLNRFLLLFPLSIYLYYIW